MCGTTSSSLCTTVHHKLSLVKYSKASQQPNQTPSERLCIYEYDARRPGDFPADSPTDSLDSGMGGTPTSELLPPGSTNLYDLWKIVTPDHFATRGDKIYSSREEKKLSPDLNQPRLSCSTTLDKTISKHRPRKPNEIAPAHWASFNGFPVDPRLVKVPCFKSDPFVLLAD
ncbi:hypothetical protein BP00DRAFT_29082 [Aspergillus indologenus CBS 114.80]|uniref:Uncharacterized protein n=1 Tax=Aspergillus indologenus CBS 114.80 TaxID=1450541 RepID=A0A2V5HS23_9EURO|nr:hypothetical protein BP00DRAFT_29082 [Aspergillus indologenus CBS 114.80]